MNILLNKKKTEDGIYYYASIEKKDKSFLDIYLLMDNNKKITFDYINLDTIEDFNVFKEGMERLYSYALKDNNIFDKFFIGDIVFGIDSRNNIILGEIVSFEDTIYNSFNVKIKRMNDTYNIDNQKNISYSQILSLNLENFAHIEDKEGLDLIEDVRREYQYQKVYFNRINDHIDKTTKNIDFLNKKLKNINKYIDILEKKEQTEKIQKGLSDLIKAKKQIETKKKNSVLKVNREKRLKEKLIEDRVFYNIFNDIKEKTK